MAYFDSNRQATRGLRVWRQVLASIAARMIAPPASEAGPGFSPCASHAQTGLSAGSSNKTVVASNAGTWRIARVTKTYASPICSTPRYTITAALTAFVGVAGNAMGSATKNLITDRAVTVAVAAWSAP